jgi:hypothetical protein
MGSTPSPSGSGVISAPNSRQPSMEIPDYSFDLEAGDGVSTKVVDLGRIRTRASQAMVEQQVESFEHGAFPSIVGTEDHRASSGTEAEMLQGPEAIDGEPT